MFACLLGQSKPPSGRRDDSMRTAGVSTPQKGTLVFRLRLWCENLIGVDPLGNLPIDNLGGNVTRQSSADKPLALTNRLHSG